MFKLQVLTSLTVRCAVYCHAMFQFISKEFCYKDKNPTIPLYSFFYFWPFFMSYGSPNYHNFTLYIFWSDLYKFGTKEYSHSL